jgi:hypothetical protein
VDVPSDHVGVGEPDGVPLRARLPLASDDIAVVVGQIGHALVAAHAAGLAHGDLTIERVFVTDDGFVRVYGFAATIDDYRHVRDDVVGLATLATEIVGDRAPAGFAAWQDRTKVEHRTVSECVAELREMFPLPGARGGAANGTGGDSRRFEVAAARSDRRARRARRLDRIGPRLFAAALTVAALFTLFRLRPEAAPAATAPRTTTRPSVTTSAIEAYQAPRASTDVLSIDRGNCPTRYLGDPLLASRERAHRCVRAVLYDRLLEKGLATLKPEERAALKRACATLDDLGCVLKVEP